MSLPKYEVEVKSLLGSARAADALRSGLKRIDPACTLLTSYTQINHYFVGGDPLKLAEQLAPHLPSDVVSQMRMMAKGEKISLRTREMNGIAKIVMKASVGNDSSANGVARMELEEPVTGMTLAMLDKEVLSVGYTYQAKWSRSREEYRVHDVAVCLDKNAGYGYVAEFEKVIDDGTKTAEAKEEIARVMQTLGVIELPQARLERMFAYYNEHWPEFYGTDKIFNVE
jgi:adenylate cyclase class IV